MEVLNADKIRQNFMLQSFSHYTQLLGCYKTKVDHKIEVFNVEILYVSRFPSRSRTTQDVLDALEGDDEGVKPAKEHYHGCVQYVQNGVSQMALIFGSSLMISVMEHDCTFVFADATFHTAPKPFVQVFNILVSYKGVVLPIFHILMTSKHYGLYKAIFDRLAEQFPHFRPTFTNTDFEGALIKTIRLTFPTAVINGCWFHYAKAVLRAIYGASEYIFLTLF